MIANLKLLLIKFDSSVDVLVIGAGPTGLGAAKRLNQLVRKCPHIRAGSDLMSHAERALMDDRGLERDTWWSGFNRRNPRRICEQFLFAKT